MTETDRSSQGLIPGRECGSCNACCVVPMIDKPDIQKKSGLVCLHCAGGSCDIYESRPQVCREFICAWRQMDVFKPEWRPDMSGVLAEIVTRGVPAHFATLSGISLTLIANPLKTVRQPWFIDFVANGVTNNIPLFLMVPGPPGYAAAKALLNTREMSEAASKSRGAVKAILEQALKALSTYSFQEHGITHTGNDVGLAG